MRKSPEWPFETGCIAAVENWVWVRFDGRAFAFAGRGRSYQPHVYRPHRRLEIIEFVRNGRTPPGPAKEFEPTEQTIRHCTTQAAGTDLLRLSPAMAGDWLLTSWTVLHH